MSPIEEQNRHDRHVMWNHCFNTRLHINEINRTGPGVLQNAEIISNGKQCIKSSQRVGSWVIPAGSVCPETEPRLQRQSWHLVARDGGEVPRPDIRRSETAELPIGFIIKVPTWSLLRDGAPQPCAEGVPQLVSRAPLVGSLFGIDTEVVEIHRNVAAERSRAVYPPKAGLVIGTIVEKSKAIEIRTHGEAIDMPRPDLAHDLKSNKTLSHIWSFPDRYQTAGTVV